MAQQIKPFSVGLLRQITDYYDEGKISYGRMVEILNEIAIEWHEKIIKDKYERITNSKEN